MSEAIQTTEEQQPEVTTNLSENLQSAIWGDKPLQSSAAPENAPVQETKKEEAVVEEVAIPKDWLKKEFDIEDPAILKAEREELKTLRSKAPEKEEIKFANEQSRLLVEYLKEGKEDEALEILNNKKKIDKIIAAEVTEATAADIIKMSIKNKFKEFGDAEVERKFNKQFGLPKEPVYNELTETEEDFNAKHDEWKEKVADIKADLLMEAKVLKPELQKLSAELILPDIFKKEQSAQPTQEDLDAANKMRTSFLQAAEETVNSFPGFSVSVKDKDVDLSANYAPSKEEKTMINERLKTFAESGFDANAILADRWVKEDGKTLNVNQMTEDLSRILFGDKASQTLSTDVVNQRIEMFLKEKKNINVNEASSKGNFTPDAKSSSEKLQEAYWGN